MGASRDWDVSYGFIVTALVLPWEAATLFRLPSQTQTAHVPAHCLPLTESTVVFHFTFPDTEPWVKDRGRVFSAKTVLWSFPGCYVSLTPGQKSGENIH